MRAVIVFVLLAIVFCAAFAQTTPSDPVKTIRISGAVIDPAGAPIANAIVGLLPAGSSDTVAATTHTDQNGRFSFPGIPGKEYDLNFEKAGFKRRSLESIKTPSNKDATVSNIKMEWELLIDHATPLVPYYHFPLPTAVDPFRK